MFMMRKRFGKKLLLISNHSNEILGTVYPFCFNIQVAFVRFPNNFTHHTDTRVIFVFVSTVSTLRNMRSVRNGSSQISLMLMKFL